MPVSLKDLMKVMISGMYFEITHFLGSGQIETHSIYLITGNGALRKMSLHVIKLHEIKPFWKILSLIMCRYNLMHS